MSYDYLLLCVIVCVLLSHTTVTQLPPSQSQSSISYVTDIMPTETVILVEAEARLGSVARLPCDLTTPITMDSLSIVIWYKDDGKSPIYSMDVRGKSLDQATHWSEDPAYKSRLLYSPDYPSSFLSLDAVTEADAGIYKCRVDFKHSPTKNYLVNLTVLVPPKSLELYDAMTGRKITAPMFGPVAERTNVEIVCTATGGWPTPVVSWFRDDELVDNLIDAQAAGQVSNTLLLLGVTREHFGANYECRATTSPNFPAIRASVLLDIYLGPLTVKLMGQNVPLSAGREYELACQSSGSRPPAVITWWRAGSQIEAPARVTPSNDGNSSISRITFMADVEDLGSSLSCRASNPNVPASALEDSWTLDIHYVPVVGVELGSNINASYIKEGMDVYFECNVIANPPARKVSWIHNSHPVTANVSTGTFISTKTLVLQSVTRAHTGAYSCVATNSEGDGYSLPFHLDVKFGPTCHTTQQRVIGAARLEKLTVNCEVDGNPSVRWFRWTFNNSAIQGRPVDSFESVPVGGNSVATFMPVTESDYGTLLCWGRNDIGSQAVPCVFHIVPAGNPDTPSNCSVIEKDHRTLRIKCTKGFDGGLPQQFIAEVRDSVGLLIRNITARGQVEFNVTELEPGATYNVTVFSTNGKGRSPENVLLQGTTDKYEHTTLYQRVSEESMKDVDPLMLMGLGALTGLVLIFIIFVLTIRLRKRSRCPADNKADYEKSTSAQTSISLPPPTVDDDRNPDVVPHTTELEEIEVGMELSPVPPWDTSHVSGTAPVPAPTPATHYTHTHLVKDAPVRWWSSGEPGPTCLRNAETQTPGGPPRHKESTV